MLGGVPLRPLVALACTGLLAMRALVAAASNADERALVPSLHEAAT